MAGRCVCQICTCGRHRCPHKRGTLGAEPVKIKCNLSEYTQKYKPHNYQPPRTGLGPPRKAHVSNEPFQGETTYSKCFFSKKPERIEIPRSEYRPPSGYFDFDSTYRKEFTMKKATREATVRHPNQYVLPATKFVGDTEYNTSFQGNSLGPPKPIRHSSNLRVDKGEVEKTTTMKNDYKGYNNFTRTPKARPPGDNHDRWNLGDVGTTSYTADFHPKEIPQIHIIPKKEWEPPTKPFTVLSTYRNTYKPHPAYKMVPSYKPDNTYAPPVTPFMDKTTTRETYQPWDIPPRSKPAWGDYQLHTSKGPFENVTSYKEAFLGKSTPREKPASNRAATTIALSHGSKEFHKNTEYTDRFKNHKTAQRAIPKPHSMETYVPTGTMECGTTYTSDYTSKKAEKTEVVNPVLQRSSGDAEWGFPTSYDTTYNETFTGNQTQCPASGLVPTHGATKLLKKATSTLEHTGQDAGHYFFIPRDASKAKDTPVSTDANSNVAKAVNTTNNSASSNLPLQDRSALKNSEKIVQTPAFSPDGSRLSTPGVKFDTPKKKFAFYSPSFEKSMSTTYRRPATPMPSKKSQDYCDFMSDKTSHCREGMSYYEPNSTYNNTTMNTSLYDEAPCTCNASYNNNNLIENNNDIITKDLMATSGSGLDICEEALVDTVDFEQMLEVTSIMPSGEETWNMSQ